MAHQPSVIVYLTPLALVVALLVFAPTSALIGGPPTSHRPEYISIIYVYNPQTRERTVLCTATLISPYRALTSCYCANYAMLVAQSYQEPFPYQAEVYFAIGMTSLEPSAFTAQNKAGKIYTKKLSYSDIYCPSTANLYDTTNYPADIAVIDIGDVDIKKYKLKPIHLAVDLPPMGSKNTFVVTWSSDSCEENVKPRKDLGISTIVDCGQTKIPLSECSEDALCTKYSKGVQLNLGDNGGPQLINGTSHPFDIQFGVIGRQRKTQPYGNGCTVDGEAQINTMLIPYIDWIRDMAPFAKFVSINSA